MVHIFLSGAGGVGKTTLAGELRKLKRFEDYKTIDEVARDLMRREELTRNDLEGDEDVYLQFQWRVLKAQRRREAALAEEEERDFVSDRSILDCLAYVLCIRDWDFLEKEIERHKVAALQGGPTPINN